MYIETSSNLLFRGVWRLLIEKYFILSINIFMDTYYNLVHIKTVVIDKNNYSKSKKFIKNKKGTAISIVNIYISKKLVRLQIVVIHVYMW